MAFVSKANQFPAQSVLLQLRHDVQKVKLRVLCGLEPLGALLLSKQTFTEATTGDASVSLCARAFKQGSGPVLYQTVCLYQQSGVKLFRINKYMT